MAMLGKRSGRTHGGDNVSAWFWLTSKSWANKDQRWKCSWKGEWLVRIHGTCSVRVCRAHTEPLTWLAMGEGEWCERRSRMYHWGARSLRAGTHGAKAPKGCGPGDGVNTCAC